MTTKATTTKTPKAPKAPAIPETSAAFKRFLAEQAYAVDIAKAHGQDDEVKRLKAEQETIKKCFKAKQRRDNDVKRIEIDAVNREKADKARKKLNKASSAGILATASANAQAMYTKNLDACVDPRTSDGVIEYLRIIADTEMDMADRKDDIRELAILCAKADNGGQWCQALVQTNQRSFEEKDRNGELSDDPTLPLAGLDLQYLEGDRKDQIGSISKDAIAAAEYMKGRFMLKEGTKFYDAASVLSACEGVIDLIASGKIGEAFPWEPTTI